MSKLIQLLTLSTALCLWLAACAGNGTTSSEMTPQITPIEPTKTVVINTQSPLRTIVITPGMPEKSITVTPVREGRTVVVTPAIRGNSEILNVGDRLEIRIPTIPTPGFAWQVQDLNTSILRQEGQAVYTADTSPNSAGGITTLTFIAVGPGKTSLTLLYLKPAWEGVPAVAKNSFGMLVEVK